MRVKQGDLVYIIARPKTGKTWFVTAIACQLAKKYNVTFISAEMYPDEI